MTQTHPERREFKVNFLIVGAQKCGTSALAHFLAQHPEICMAPRKEAHFLDAPDFDDGADFNSMNARYAEFFPNYSGQPLVGEATPIYMFLPEAAPRIVRYNPAMRLIILLRDPVERAISHYSMERGRGAEHLPFEVALLAEKFRMRRDRRNFAMGSSLRAHSYLTRGFFTRQIARLLEFFPRDQILILSSEALRHDHEAALRRVHAFLGVKNFVPARAEIFSTINKRAISPLTRALLSLIYRGEKRRMRALLRG